MERGKRGARSLYRRSRSAFAIVSAGLLAMALWIVVPALKTYLDAEDSLVAVREYEALLIASRGISAERGPSNVVMSIEPGSDAKAVARLAEMRQATDDALSLVDATRSLPLAPGAIGTIRARLAAARAGVDTVARMPSKERTRNDLTGAIAAMIGVVDALHPSVARAAETMELRNTDIAGGALTAIVITDLREQAGRLGSYIVPSVSRRLQLSPEAVDQISRTQGSIDQLMAILKVRLDVKDAGLRGHMREIERLFVGQGLRLMERLTLEGRVSGDYSIAPAALTGLYVPTLAPLEELRQAAITSMVGTIVDSRQTALLHLIGVITVTLCLLIFLVFLMRRLILSILSPLLMAREMIVGLADERPVALKRPPTDVSELTDLFKAITQLEHKLAERRELTERLRFQAQTDPLTGLLNRSHFSSLAEARLSREEGRAGIVYIDLDGFKSVNDTLGHFAGDRLLGEIASRLKNGLGADNLIARLGGDEFAICTLGLDRNGHEALATRILKLFDEPIDIGEVPVKAAASLGIALAPLPGRHRHDFSVLCGKADAALYDAKRAGRGTYRIFKEPDVIGDREIPIPRAMAG